MLRQFLHISFLLFFMNSFSQQVLDSTSVAYATEKNKHEIQEEEKELNFKNFFFEALQQKAIGNFDKAISSLENCQNIKPNDVAVNFEFGKNYFQLEKYIEAESYTKKALELDSENLDILVLLKEIYNKQSNFKDALEVQKKIAEKKPGNQLDLVILYIKNNKIDDARQLLIELEKNGTLSANLIPFKESLLKGTVLTPTSVPQGKSVEEQSIEELKITYQSNKNFTVFKELLIKLNEKKKYTELETESKEGLELFPAQPLVYLMYATSLNQSKQYEKALSILQNGIDYVIDDGNLEADFYDQMSLSYKGMGQNVNASKYLNKAVSMRQKKS
ncbi:MAG: hypothetical protein KDC47_07580 [Flavobacteriaceae bacterium]|nr:hypothetical protein [Flavobacteriaceae bacterium]